MIDRLTRRFLGALVGTAAALFVLSGCVVQQQRPITRLYAEKATAEVPADELLDVGVRLFDPNIPENEAEREKKRVFPDVRHAESRYIPTLIRDTLEDTGQWGAARVVPSSVNSFDMTVDAKIVESNGAYLKLEVTAHDATGKVWIDKKEYEGQADTRVYRDNYTAGRDPFENVYVLIANDLLAVRNTKTATDLANIRHVSEMRFAADFAPVAFSQYLSQNKKSGEYKVLRLPAEDDVLVKRINQIRERDYGMIDTVSENYTAFSERLEERRIPERGQFRVLHHVVRELRHERARRVLFGNPVCRDR